jgi:hypothetical protein
MQLGDVIPWGRSLAEYKAMFNLTDADLNKKILGCSDGPASFNAELTQLNGDITSVDPLYQFTKQQIQQRIDQVAPQVITEVEKNKDNFIWDSFNSPDELMTHRLNSMSQFLDDYQQGCKQKRYLNQSLPSLSFADQQFDLALCSHFLFLYSDHLSYEFHLNSLIELSRVANQVRIYPLINLDNTPSSYLESCIEQLINIGLKAELKHNHYMFQKSADKYLLISQYPPPITPPHKKGR